MTARLLTGATLAALLLGGNVAAQQNRTLKSGPQVGARNDRSGFFPQFVAGPSTGKRLCPVWNSDYDLVALIFVREASDPLASLVKKIDERLTTAGNTPRAMGVYVIFMDGGEGLDQRLRSMSVQEGLKRVNLCIGAPPANYQVAKDADLTAVIYNPGRRPEQRVTANFALRKGELNDATTDAIVQAVSQMLAK